MCDNSSVIDQMSHMLDLALLASRLLYWSSPFCHSGGRPLQVMVPKFPVRFGHWEAKGKGCRQKVKKTGYFSSLLPHSPTQPLPILGDVSRRDHASSVAPTPLDWPAMGLVSDSRYQKSKKHDRKILKPRNFCSLT